MPISKSCSRLYIYSYLNLAFNLCLGKVLIMGGEKHNHCWIHVTKVENGHEWICKHCNLSKVREDIRRCSNHLVAGNEGVHNNIASTSSNPSEVVNRSIHSIQVQGKLKAVFTSTPFHIRCVN
jgi:hypothetical protein